MRYSVVDYLVIIKACKNITSLDKVKELFDEDSKEYTTFERKVINDKITDHKQLIK